MSTTASVNTVAVALKAESGPELRFWITERQGGLANKGGIMLPPDATCAQVYDCVVQGLEADTNKAVADQMQQQLHFKLRAQFNLQRVQSKGRSLPRDGTLASSIVTPGDEIIVDGVLRQHMTFRVCALL